MKGAAAKFQETATPAVEWYDAHAASIADGYESIDARAAHPELFALLADREKLRILDVGSGTGRDATALAELGHEVVAVDPSRKMLQLARALHPNAKVAWKRDSLPLLQGENGRYDLIVLSAVWMHVPPSEREAAFSRLGTLLTPNGLIYVTLRSGPDDLARGMYEVDALELEQLAHSCDMRVQDMGSRLDLLGRSEVRWRSLLIKR